MTPRVHLFTQARYRACFVPVDEATQEPTPERKRLNSQVFFSLAPQHDDLLCPTMILSRQCCHSIQFSNQDSANTSQKYCLLWDALLTPFRQRQEWRTTLSLLYALNKTGRARREKHFFPDLLYIKLLYLDCIQQKITNKPALWRHGSSKFKDFNNYTIAH